MAHQHKKMTSLLVVELRSSHCNMIANDGLKTPQWLKDCWPNTMKIIKFWKALTKGKQPTCKNFEQLVKAVYDNFTLAKLPFFLFIVNHLKQFLTTCQTSAAMIPFRYSDLLELPGKNLKLYIKPGKWGRNRNARFSLSDAGLDRNKLVQSGNMAYHFFLFCIRHMVNFTLERIFLGKHYKNVLVKVFI